MNGKGRIEQGFHGLTNSLTKPPENMDQILFYQTSVCLDDVIMVTRLHNKTPQEITTKVRKLEKTGYRASKTSPKATWLGHKIEKEKNVEKNRNHSAIKTLAIK